MRFVEMIQSHRELHGSDTARVSIEEKLIAVCALSPEGRRLPTRSSSSSEPNPRLINAARHASGFLLPRVNYKLWQSRAVTFRASPRTWEYLLGPEVSLLLSERSAFWSQVTLPTVVGSRSFPL